MSWPRTAAKHGWPVAAVLLACTIWFFAGKVPGKPLPTARLSQDARYYYVWLPSLVLHGDLDFTDEYKVVGNPFSLANAPSGTPANPFGVGPALYALPFFAAGHALAAASGGPADGFSTVETKATLFASCVFGVLALVPAILLLRRRAGLGPYASAAVAIAMWAAGPSLFYAVRQPGYSHPFATFFAALLVERWDASFAERARSLRTWLVLGALLGAATLARPQLALWGLCLAWAAVDDARRAPLRACAPRWALAALAALVVTAPQMIVWKLMYGRVWLVPQGDSFMRWDAPAYLAVLFSSRNGLFPWAPAYALATIGLIVGLRRAPRLGAVLLGGFLLQLLINAAAWDWWGGGSFGGRRFDSCYVAFAFGAAAFVPPLFARAPVRRIAAGAACVVALLLSLANTVMAGASSSFSVPNAGVGPASTALRSMIRGPLGAFAGWASALTSYPVRLAFAWRYGTSTAAYDRVEGYHFLKEQCPCIEPDSAKLAAELRLVDATSPFVLGLVAGDRNGVKLSGSRARILVPLNLRGPVFVTLQASAGAPAPVALSWNGAAAASATVGAAPQAIHFTADNARRGVNVLDIEAPPGTRLHVLQLGMPAPR